MLNLNNWHPSYLRKSSEQLFREWSETDFPKPISKSSEQLFREWSETDFPKPISNPVNPLHPLNHVQNWE